MDSVILKVVVESALANAVVFVSAFGHRLLEVAREVKHLKIAVIIFELIRVSLFKSLISSLEYNN